LRASTAPAAPCWGVEQRAAIRINMDIPMHISQIHGESGPFIKSSSKNPKSHRFVNGTSKIPYLTDLISAPPNSREPNGQYFAPTLIGEA
jgi:hypothetical protein